MGNAKLRSSVQRVIASAVAAAGMTAGLVIGTGSTAAAAPALPPLPPIGSAEIAGALDQVSGVLTTVGGALDSLQNLGAGSSSGLPFGGLGSLGSLGLGGVVRPASGPITTYFGGGHMGIDIAAPMGAPILAAGNGTVINSGPASGFGLWIRIRHDDGTVTTYGHNDRNLVSVGQRVTAGQRIADVGSRGNSTGPHLHFEVDLPGGIKTDPIAWLVTHGVLMF
ncbi:M23 family metallopeptidase [Prescottella subtropica]|uniref:M23 family metallopeptidase n=1 Tax=Prescottella subtropica TaxID=2545757 RepID=UPI0010F8F785|nr:M23 family metallopeptidase [Prescottella subtropica]